MIYGNHAGYVVSDDMCSYPGTYDMIYGVDWYTDGSPDAFGDPDEEVAGSHVYGRNGAGYAVGAAGSCNAEYTYVASH